MKLLLLIVLSSSIFAKAQTLDPQATHGPSAQQALYMQNWNKYLSENSFQINSDIDSSAGYRPFADYENVGYLFLSSAVLFNTQGTKYEIAKNLPAGVKLVLFGVDVDRQSLINEYSAYIDPSRLIILNLPNSVGLGYNFWARDNTPIPLINTTSGKLALVNARYYYNFEPDQEFAQKLNVDLISHTYYFEGGNFMANRLGACFIVNNYRIATAPDSLFTGKYGCQTLTRLPFVSGIGHVDEHARFINDTTVITDLDLYKTIFQQKGYVVHMLPRPDQELETYTNSLTINGTVFVPIYDEKNDNAALDVYKSLGLKVVPLHSMTLSNKGQGSIHCISMAYPSVPDPKFLQ